MAVGGPTPGVVLVGNLIPAPVGRACHGSALPGVTILSESRSREPSEPASEIYPSTVVPFEVPGRMSVEHPGPTPPSAERRARPIGVTIIAVLAAISGLYTLLAAMTILSIAGAVGGLGLMIGLFVFAVAVVSLVFAWGAWTLRPWAWTLGVVLEVLAALQGLSQVASGDAGGVVSLLVAGVILWYLFTPDVKAAFGRA